MATDLTTQETNGGDSEPDVNMIEFSVGTSRTINLGNFESLKVEASVTIEVHEGDDLKELRANAQKQLRKLLEDTYLAQHKPDKRA